MEKKRTILLALVLGIMLLAQTVLADPTAPTQLNRESSSNRDLSTLPAKQVNAIAGNVTELSIDALSITNGWQGYYGNVSGVITLDDASNNTFYNWSATSVRGEIYASRVSSITWGGTACTDAAGITTEESNLSMAASDADSVSNTFFNTTSHPSFLVGNTNITADSCYATNAFDNTGAQTSNFYQVLLSDGSGNILYTTLMRGAATGFNGDSWDFELLVGEDGHANSAVTPYYFWVEIN